MVRVIVSVNVGTGAARLDPSSSKGRMRTCNKDEKPLLKSEGANCRQSDDLIDTVQIPVVVIVIAQGI